MWEGWSKLCPRAALAPLAFGLLILAGCGEGTPAPAAADENEARKTLDSALTAWLKGETVDAMKKASPSIIVADHKWERSDKLTKFEVEGPGKPLGAARAFQVKLWLTDAKGKKTQDVAEYKVGTDPIYTVARSVFH
jgi:hypothetical protein